MMLKKPPKRLIVMSAGVLLTKASPLLLGCALSAGLLGFILPIACLCLGVPSFGHYPVPF